MNEYCSSGKRRYSNSRRAKQAMKRIQSLGKKVRAVYRCQECHGWHLTSKPRWK